MVLNAFQFYGPLIRALLSSLVSCEVQGKLNSTFIDLFCLEFLKIDSYAWNQNSRVIDLDLN